jgi:hypothetical protein
LRQGVVYTRGELNVLNLIASLEYYGYP